MHDAQPAWLQLPAARQAAAERRYGALVRIVRIEAGLTLEDAGRLVGYSAATLSRMERGLQPLTDVRVLRHFATMFAIPPHLFGLADAPSTAPSTHAAGFPDTLPGRTASKGGPVHRRQLLNAITGVVVAPLLDTAGPTTDDPARRLVTALETLVHHGYAGATPVEPPVLRTGMLAANADFQASRYRRLAERLPKLLAAADADPSSDPAVAAELYNTATHALIRLETGGSGWLTAQRAITAARASGDPAVIANVTRTLAILYRRAGRYELAQRLALDAVDKLPITGRTPSSVYLSLYGTLLCSAGYAAAQGGDRATAAELLDHAAQTADRLNGDHNTYWTAFGPTNVVSFRISAAVALGDAGTAIEYAASIPPGAIRLPERQSRFWVDVARAYHQWGKPARCYQALLTAERLAPEEVRARPAVRSLVTDLLSMPPQAGMASVRELARRVGVGSANPTL
jgi:hypothetical protein